MFKFSKITSQISGPPLPTKFGVNGEANKLWKDSCSSKDASDVHLCCSHTRIRLSKPGWIPWGGNISPGTVRICCCFLLIIRAKVESHESEVERMSFKNNLASLRDSKSKRFKAKKYKVLQTQQQAHLMALVAFEWCEKEGHGSVFNPLLLHFYKSVTNPGAAEQSDRWKINE